MASKCRYVMKKNFLQSSFKDKKLCNQLRYAQERCYCRFSRQTIQEERNRNTTMSFTRSLNLFRPSLFYSTRNNNILQCRTFLGLPHMPQVLKGKRKEFSERKLLGFSMDNMYDVVANVDDYKHFVPWCRDSKIIETKPGHLRAVLEIGFPPLIERYSSILTVARPNLVKSECIDGDLFNYMCAVWRFSRGIPGRDDTCTLDFHIAFEFKSAFHSHLSTMFFDEVVKKMVKAFENRCESIHGCSMPSRPSFKRRRKLSIHRPVESR